MLCTGRIPAAGTWPARCDVINLALAARCLTGRNVSGKELFFGSSSEENIREMSSRANRDLYNGERVPWVQRDGKKASKLHLRFQFPRHASRNIIRLHTAASCRRPPSIEEGNHHACRVKITTTGLESQECIFLPERGIWCSPRPS